MQLLSEKFNKKKIEECLITENKFISSLLKRSCIPERKEAENEDIIENNKKLPFELNSNKKERARSLVELQQRLDAIRGKKKQTYKEKLVKKGIKNRLKKKTQQDLRNANKKQERATKLSTAPQQVKEEEVEEKKVVKTENKIEFSKVDFEHTNRKVKPKKDPKKLLENLQKQKETLEELKKRGEIEKAVEIKEKTAWKNALAKAEGEKIKDDPTLLKKTIKRKEQKQRSSKKKWQQRNEKVEKAKQERQTKRNENLMKRKKDKKVNKLKKAVKKGKVIPGF
ncbi:unnamed protein product [Phyllotreta striolata]|uniref:Ribosomal RNA-processing protein 14/surfeit locus protein 6 C-terminal domain-containing protein n=1 Tax=Phyllotreta striolata TaxID=444603 RepID=A0A9N9TUW7_PHYSR|nr:unnamed protein product [Phyllotreta striolata]